MVVSVVIWRLSLDQQIRRYLYSPGPGGRLDRRNPGRTATSPRPQPRHPAEPTSGQHIGANDIAAILDELGDLITALGEAEPDHKLGSLGLRLTYHPETQTVRAKIDLGKHRWDLVRVRGWTRTKTPRGPQLCGIIPLSASPSGSCT